MSAMVLGGVLIGLYFALLYVSAACKYEFTEKTLRIQWRVLWWIPLPFHRLSLEVSNIARIRRFSLRRDLRIGGAFFGPVSLSRETTIVFKRGIWLGMVKRLYVAPSDPEWLIAEVQRRLAAEPP